MSCPKSFAKPSYSRSGVNCKVTGYTNEGSVSSTSVAEGGRKCGATPDFALRAYPGFGGLNPAAERADSRPGGAKGGFCMAQTLRRLAGLTFAAVLAAPALAQTTGELGWCANDAAATPALQIKDCSRVIQSGKASPANVILALTIRGRAYLAVGDPADALKDLDTAIAAEPSNAAALSLRGGVHAMRREFDLAIADYDAALKLDPKLAAAISDRGL